MSTNTWIDEFIDLDEGQPEPSTAPQRRYLYKLGYSEWFVHKFVKTKYQATRLIARAIKNKNELIRENEATHAANQDPISVRIGITVERV